MAAWLELELDNLGSARRPCTYQYVANAIPDGPEVARRTSGGKASKSSGANAPERLARVARISHAANVAALAAATDVPQLKPISTEDAAAGVQPFPPESDEGAQEYKLRLKDPDYSPTRFQQLVTQLRFRLMEGNGECQYFIGVEDDGYPRGLNKADLAVSLDALAAMAAEAGAAAYLEEQVPGTRDRTCAIMRVRRVTQEDVSYTDLRIAVAGGVDSGKSTLVAVLTHGAGGRPLLDDSLGSARMAVLRHKHEIESGRTSSISQQMLGYDAEGRVLNYSGVTQLTPAEIGAAAARVLRFIDLSGHEKYLKTALYGMTCMLPDYVLLCVSPSAGVSRAAREHLAVALALEVPVTVVLTRADAVTPDALAAVVRDVRAAVLAASGADADKQGGRTGLAEILTPLISTSAMALKAAARLGRRHPPGSGSSNGRRQHRLSQPVVPLFPVSSVTGQGIPTLHAFLARLQAPGAQPSWQAQAAASQPVANGQTGPSETVNEPEQRNGAGAAARQSSGCRARHAAPPHFQVDHTFAVRGVGPVLSGTVVSGSISLGQQLLLGPSSAGAFVPVEVACIQRSQVPVRQVGSGQHATVALRPQDAAAAELTPALHPDPQRGPPAAQPPSPAAAAAEQRQAQEAGQAGAASPPAAAARPGLADESGGSAGAWRQAQDPSQLDFREPRLPAGAAAGGGPAPAGTQQADSGSSCSSAAGQQGAWPGNAVLGGRSSSSISMPAARQGQLRVNCPSNTRWRGPSQAAEGSAWDEGVPSPARGSSPPNSRKGMVLLDAALQPRAVWQFEAVLVLLAGHWPARGLLTGRWPPGEGLERGQAASPPAEGDNSAVRERKRRQGACYGPVIHCGSVRQSAGVVAVQEVGSLSELQSGQGHGSTHVAGCNLAAAVAAAAVLLGQQGSSGGWQAPVDGAAPTPGCIVQHALEVDFLSLQVTFRFTHRPEWLMPDAKLIVRDQTDCCMAGAGMVRTLCYDAG